MDELHVADSNCWVVVFSLNNGDLAVTRIVMVKCRFMVVETEIAEGFTILQRKYVA